MMQLLNVFFQLPLFLAFCQGYWAVDTHLLQKQLSLLLSAHLNTVLGIEVLYLEGVVF